MARHVAHFLGRAALVTVLFCLVYGACDAITAARSTRVRVHMDWELAIPFVPWTTLVYSSVYLLFPLTPFLLRRRADVDRFGLAIAIQILVAGLCFLAIPAEPAYPAAARDLGRWAAPFQVADAVNLRYNMVPSLHVALAASCAFGFSRYVPGASRVLLAVWASAVCVSTLTTHQHHVVDVVAGVALAWGTIAALGVGARERDEEDGSERALAA